MEFTNYLGEYKKRLMRHRRKPITLLHYKRIPIENGWCVSMLLHDARCPSDVPWEICTECEVLTSKVIKHLFGRENEVIK